MTYGFRTDPSVFHCRHCGDDIDLFRVGPPLQRRHMNRRLVELHRDYCGASLIAAIEDYLRQVTS